MLAMGNNRTILQFIENQVLLRPISENGLIFFRNRDKGWCCFLARQLYRSGSHDITNRAGERMIYRYAVINPGQNYNSSTGEYTCPVTGIYSFAYSIFGYKVMKGDTQFKADAELYKEGSMVSKIFINSQNSEDIDISLSLSDIVQCRQGDRVWVQSSSNNNHIFGHALLNMFSGVLLYIS